METERIFIRGVDRTNDIKSYELIDNKCHVLFKNRNKKYSYSLKKISIERKSNDPFVAYKEIANNSKVKEDFSALGKYYDNVTIKENSLIHKYLNGIPLDSFNDDNPLIFPFRFNMSQLDATRRAFTNELSIIQGPPGTGKTQTILNIIANIIILDENVAVVSNNNAAVENVKDKLNENEYSYIFAQLGNKVNQVKFFENQSLDIGDISTKKLTQSGLEISNIMLADYSAKLEFLNNVDREKNKVTEELNALKLEQSYYNNIERIEDLEEELYISFRSLGYDKIIDFLVDHRIMITENEKLNFINKFKLFVKYGIYKFRELQDNDDEVVSRFQKIYYKLKVNDLEKNLSNCIKELKSQKFDDFVEKHQNISKNIFDHHLSQRFKENKKTYTKENFKLNFDSFIEDYPIILSTAYSITYSAKKDFVFDYIIVDEASTLDLVKAMLPLSCAKNIIIVGDQKQLPHIPEKTDYIFDNEAYDYTNQNLMSSLDCLYGDTLQRTLLKEHYRCHPDIIRFCNMKYYNGELIVYSKCNNCNPISVIKTAPGNHMREITKGKKGTFNQRELEELNNLIANKTDYKIKLYSEDLNDLGLITPYRYQVELAEKLNPKAIEKDTVHKYQGREKHIIVYSTILDQSFKSIFKMSFVNDSKMVNVAVSRAKNQLILISDVNTFKAKNGNNIGDLLKYIEYHDENNLKEGQIVSVFDLLYKEYSRKLLSRKKAMHNIKKDIKFDSEK